MNLRIMTWQHFELLCARILQQEGYAVQTLSGKAADIGIDILAKDTHHGDWAVQIKYSRAEIAARAQVTVGIDQLQRAADYLQIRNRLLVFSSRVSADAKQRCLQASPPITIWDETDITELLAKHVDTAREFEALLGAQTLIEQRVIDPIKANPRASELADRLADLEPGEANWKKFEELGVEIINYAFFPHLGAPHIQSWSEDGLDRRDAIYPIAHGHGFWDNLKRECSTRFVVAEFKNYASSPGQTEIESIQQYLFAKAMRSFGILCCRKPPSEHCLIARRRAWMENSRLIVVLSDADLLQILEAKALNEEPTAIIDAQLNDFFMRLTP